MPQLTPAPATLAARVRAAGLPLLTDRAEPAARLAARAYERARAALVIARADAAMDLPADLGAAEHRLAAAEARAVAALRASPRLRRVAARLASGRGWPVAEVEAALARANLNPHAAARALERADRRGGGYLDSPLSPLPSTYTGPAFDLEAPWAGTLLVGEP